MVNCQYRFRCTNPPGSSRNFRIRIRILKRADRICLSGCRVRGKFRRIALCLRSDINSNLNYGPGPDGRVDRIGTEHGFSGGSQRADLPGFQPHGRRGHPGQGRQGTVLQVKSQSCIVRCLNLGERIVPGCAGIEKFALCRGYVNSQGKVYSHFRFSGNISMKNLKNSIPVGSIVQ